MFRKNALFLTLAAALMVGGCASYGNENIRNVTEENLSSKIEKGKTTKSDIRQLLGAPDFVSFTDSGNEIWRYAHQKSRVKGVSLIPIVGAFAAGTNDEKKEVVFFFNTAGVLLNYSMNTTKGETRQGVFAK